jgi:methyltransferase-like protein 6
MSQIPEFWQKKYKDEAAKNWNLFYKRNEARFFKDRHWIGREFPELFEASTKVSFLNEFSIAYSFRKYLKLDVELEISLYLF